MPVLYLLRKDKKENEASPGKFNINTMGGQKKVVPHYNTVVVYKRQKVPKQFRNIHGAVQINSK